MFFFLELHGRLLAASRAELLHSFDVLLPSYPLLVLLMKAHGSHSGAIHCTKAGKNGALTTRHSGASIWIHAPRARKIHPSALSVPIVGN